MARIPDDQIERLKNEVSLERLVAGFGIELKRHGVLVQREDEGKSCRRERFRPSGGDFQGMRIYRSDFRFMRAA